MPGTAPSWSSWPFKAVWRDSTISHLAVSLRRLDRRARLGPSACRGRLLHPRGRLLLRRAAHLQRASDRVRRTRHPHPCRPPGPAHPKVGQRLPGGNGPPAATNRSQPHGPARRNQQHQHWTEDCRGPVWVEATDPAWMGGGTYLVVRRIPMLLDRWDGTPIHQQERVIGRHKIKRRPARIGTRDRRGEPAGDRRRRASLITADSHVRLSTPGDGERRRGYSYRENCFPTPPPKRACCSVWPPRCDRAASGAPPARVRLFEFSR